MIRIVLLLLFIVPNLCAQSYYKDAILFSNTQPLGSARIQALGGASASLGADPSAISSNPAGLGLYNSWEFAFTPTTNINNTNSILNNTGEKASTTKFSLDQISMVLANPERLVNDVWHGGSWGIAVQKVNDFNSTVSYQGNNPNNSLIDFFIENSDGFTADDIPNIDDAFDLTSLAYYNYLIGPWDVIDSSYPDDEYFSDVTTFYRPEVQQKEVIETSGSQYEIAVGYGGNFADVFYFGFNLALVTLNYESTKSYTESGYDYSKTDSTSYMPLNSFNANEKLTIDGTGAHLTFGIIIRPIPAFRIGASIATATVYDLNDSYETTLGAEWNNFNYKDIIYGDTLLSSTYVESAIIESNYSLKTPMKYTLGAAVFLGKMGFITLDAEFLNYGKTELESQEFSMNTENLYLEQNFSNQVNLKAGVEIRISPLRLRGGYAFNATPVDAQDILQYSNQTFSAGAGFLFDNLYTDFALIYNDRKAQYSPYLLSDYSEPIVDINSNTIRGVFTLGFKF